MSDDHPDSHHIRAVTFDLSGTLAAHTGFPADWAATANGALTAAAGTWQVTPTAPQLDAAREWLLEQNPMRNPRLHELSAEEMFRPLFGHLDVPPDLDLTRAIEIYYDHFAVGIEPFAESADVVRALLDAQVPVGILSDVPSGMPRQRTLDDIASLGADILARLRPYTLTSSEVGMRKPSPDGFMQLAALLRVRPADMLYIGNERCDIDGAHSVGATAALVWRKDGPAPDWGQELTWTDLRPVLNILSDGEPWRRARA
ncbi:MAG: HAD family hydrolase [Actinomycetes bacterium]|jgi:FMN phosphatase YigB (HAD superfamily)|nr:HAD family hydrolase [Actinomycetes bacterium]